MNFFKRALTSLVLVGTFNGWVNAQTASQFENLITSPDSIWNGSDLSGGFVDGAAFFFNDYNPAWGSWSGFSVSQTLDTSTVSWLNQYTAMTGAGVNQSPGYGVLYSDGLMTLTHSTTGDSVMGVNLNNSVYTYNTILNGDQISKKFGGATGSDPDYFMVRFYGIDVRGEVTDSVRFYLADYRGTTGDYIVRDWTWVDLRSLGRVAAIYVDFKSTDVGNFGINTPTYVCMDSLVVKNSSTVFAPVAFYDWGEVETNSMNTAIQVLDNDIDPDGGLSTLTVKQVLPAANGSATLVGGTHIEYTPPTDYSGYDTLGYVLEDTSGLIDTGLVYVLVNSAPTANDDTGSTVNGYVLNLNILLNDVDEDSASLQLSMLDTVKNGQASITNNFLQYAPDQGYIGMDSCSYILCDIYGRCDTAWVRMNITENTVGIAEQFQGTSWKVYPNPANGEIQVDWMRTAGAELHWFTLQGQLVRTDLLTAGNNRLWVSDLPEGLYILRTDAHDGQALRIQIVH